MKKIYTAIITLALSLVSTATLEGNNTDNNNVATTNSATYYINAPRFVRPLIEKWITEYQKVNPQAKFAIAKTPANKTNSALNIQLSESSGSKDLAKKTVYFAEYAILPITGKNSEAAKALGHQELNSKKIKSLFFENEDIENQDKKDKNSNWVVYTGNSTQSVANEFASHYG